jgi:hypothetical protein
MPRYGRWLRSGRICGEVEVDEITLTGKVTQRSLTVLNGEAVFMPNPDRAQFFAPAG